MPFQIADSFTNVVNPLFVLLDDSKIMEDHLAWVSQWMIMSTYSTWLLFMREITSIEGYFKNVHVSIDSRLLVSQQLSATSEEQIVCIYRIEMTDLRQEMFAFWKTKIGLVNLTKVFDEKTKDFKGKMMRFGFVDVRQTVYQDLLYGKT